VTFGEDASRVRTAALSVVRNTVIAAFRPAGATNIAEARRWTAGSRERII
jgi:hypothetical protein